MQIIGITGVSGSGKSIVSDKICKMKQAKLIDADILAKKISVKRRRVLPKNSRNFWKRNIKRRFRNR